MQFWVGWRNPTNFEWYGNSCSQNPCPIYDYCPLKATSRFEPAVSGCKIPILWGLGPTRAVQKKGPICGCFLPTPLASNIIQPNQPQPLGKRQNTATWKMPLAPTKRCSISIQSMNVRAQQANLKDRQIWKNTLFGNGTDLWLPFDHINCCPVDHPLPLTDPGPGHDEQHLLAPEEGQSVHFLPCIEHGFSPCKASLRGAGSNTHGRPTALLRHAFALASAWRSDRGCVCVCGPSAQM